MVKRFWAISWAHYLVLLVLAREIELLSFETGKSARDMLTKKSENKILNMLTMTFLDGKGESLQQLH